MDLFVYWILTSVVLVVNLCQITEINVARMTLVPIIPGQLRSSQLASITVALIGSTERPSCRLSEIAKICQYKCCNGKSQAPTYEDYTIARRYVLNLTQATWQDARDTCRQSGASLATLYDLATVPDMNFTEALKPSEGIFWIGFHNNNNVGWQWDNGDYVTWTNWQLGEPSNGSCVVANNSYQFYWSVRSCDRKFPFVCQFEGASCTFTRHANLTIFGHNFMYLFNKTETECMIRCVGSRDYTCMSFEYSPHLRTCEFNSGNRWTLARDVINLKGWVYFHRTCNFGEVVGSYIVSSSIAPTPVSSSLICQEMLTTKQILVTQDIFVSSIVPVTSPVYVTHDVTVTQTQTKTLTETETEIQTQTQIVTSIATVITTATVISTHIITPSPVLIIPSSSVFQEAIEELQEMQTVIKEKRKSLTKISVEDPRPSATYVGYMAIIFMSSVFGSIILFDLLTVFKDAKCCFSHSKKVQVTRSPSIESQPDPSNEGLPRPVPIQAFDLKGFMQSRQNKTLAEGATEGVRNSGDTMEADSNIAEISNKNTADISARVRVPKRPIDQRRLWRHLHWSSVADSGFDGSESASDTTANSENGSNRFDVSGHDQTDVIAERNEDTSSSVSSDDDHVREQEVVSVDIESNNPGRDGIGGELYEHAVVTGGGGGGENEGVDGGGTDDIAVDIADNENEQGKKSPITRL